MASRAKKSYTNLIRKKKSRQSALWYKPANGKPISKTILKYLIMYVFMT